MTLETGKEGYPLENVLKLDLDSLQVNEALAKACKRILRRTQKKKTNLLCLETIRHDLYSDEYFDYDLLCSMDEYIEVELYLQSVKKQYNKLRNCIYGIRNTLKRIWLKRIRYASRAIGNMCDYSLIMVATPPTTVPADEYVMNYLFDIRQQGGVRVGSLA